MPVQNMITHTLSSPEPDLAQWRLTFTSAEVGDGSTFDSNTQTNQDGGLAVRVQAEGPSDALIGAITRYSDEAVSFESADPAITFDVRDLVSGTERGDRFQVVRLGTSGGDNFDYQAETRAQYINAGLGNDTLRGGTANDFLVGGAGVDRMGGGFGNDTFIGGTGNDTIFGNEGNDTVIYNVATDGADQVALGTGRDVVRVSSPDATQIRLTFTSAEVGNGQATDSGILANQDGGLALRLQAENGVDGLTGPLSRFDDEGITFVSSTPGVTFDVRDLVSGAARGNVFTVVQLGTSGSERLDYSTSGRQHYMNGGSGNDTIFGGISRDFLVGGAGIDRISGNLGADTFIGGLGNDEIFGGDGDDLVIYNLATDGADQVALGTGQDIVEVSSPLATQIRVSFTSAEVGNSDARDSDTLANQDGGLAVRLQAENGADGVTGPVSRYDDEGITLVSVTGGATFDVRDLVAGTQRGDAFEIVQLGVQAGELINRSGDARAAYINGGAGNDTITGGSGDDFIVGGAGNDTLNGGEGENTLLGGSGSDTFVFTDGVGDDTIVDFDALFDVIDLRAFDITILDLSINLLGGNVEVGVNIDGSFGSDFTITVLDTSLLGILDFLL